MKPVLLALLILCSSSANASDLARTRLRETTVHLPVGTGAVVQAPSGRKIVLTNWHVCLHARVDGQVLAAYDSGVSFRGKVVSSSPTKDLCAIAAPDSAKALKLATKFSQSEHIYTRGYPGHIVTESEGQMTRIDEFAFTFGIEEVGECPKGSVKMIINEMLMGCTLRWTNGITTLYAQPGSSGSPVVNENGELVGVINSYHSSEGAGILLYPSVKAFLEKL